MKEEQLLAEFVTQLTYDQIPLDAISVVKRILMAVTGTAVAGAGEEGVAPLRSMLENRGGKPEATVFIHGDKLPAPSAAFLNGVMCRALDFCDAMAPGIHIGSSLVPAALAAVEVMGGCEGQEFITALTVGAEIGARFNLTEDLYNGFDPTGVAGIFAATASAARIMKLDNDQVLNAMALAFNRCGGSFQSNVDGSLAVRLIQGWVAESAISCVMLAKAGLTGPANFLGGVYGYMHLYAHGKRDARTVTSKLGEEYFLNQTMFKKYPSCGLTQGLTDLALQIVREVGVTADAIATVEVRLPPYAYRLVGHDFNIGRNARVNAQFSAQYCVANALLRRSSRLEHFKEEAIRNLDVLEVIQRIQVVSDDSMKVRDHTAVDLAVTTKCGITHAKSLDFAPGFPRNPLSDEEHLSRFKDCMDYAERPLSSQQVAELLALIRGIETTSDVRVLLSALVA